MPITSEDTLTEVLAGVQVHRPIHKTFTPVANAFLSLFGMPGYPGFITLPANGANGALCDDTTPGGLPFTNPAGGDKSYLAQMAMAASGHGSILLYDRLWHNQFANATTTSAQPVSHSALTRWTDGKGVEAWLVAWAAMGSGVGGTITITYTDQDGNSGATGTLQQYVISGVIGRSWQFGLASGDNGIRSIQSYQQTSSMTSGTIGLVLRRRLAMVQVSPGGVGGVLDALEAALLTVPDDACLELVWVGLSVSAINLFGSIDLAQG